MDIRRQKKIDGVAGRVARVRYDLRDLFSLGNQALTQQEAGGQLFIVPRRSHRYANGPRLDLNFQRLFGGEGILRVGRPVLPVPTQDMSIVRIHLGFFLNPDLDLKLVKEIKMKIRIKSKSGRRIPA